MPKRKKAKLAKRRDDLLDHPRLKQSEIAEWREKLYEQQGNVCGLCGMPIGTPSKRHLDHCHGLGYIRSTLHSGCNTLLSKVENNYRRMGVPFSTLGIICPNIHNYLSADYSLNPFHPTWRTKEEKRLSRNERARGSALKSSF
jgi:hypothetical protein